MFSVGETLKRARLEQGVDLSIVSAQTRINAKYLEAIEADDRTQLPSGFFYKSFVDQYARALAVDVKEIDAEIDRILAGDAPLPLPGQDSRVSKDLPPVAIGRNRFRKRRPFASIFALMLVIVGCSAVYAWWHNGHIDLEGRASTDTHVPEVARVPRVIAPPIETARPQLPATVPSAAVSVQTVSHQAAPPPETPPAIEQPVVRELVAPADSKVRVDLMAREETWLSVSSDGKPVFSGILEANQSKTVAGKQFAKVRMGNAAGLQVRLNGKMLGQLGNRGQVLVVLFTPDNFQIVTSTKEGD